MSFLNNWDLKEVNNSIYEVGGERRYVVSDMGATLGNTGNLLTRSKSDAKRLCELEIHREDRPLTSWISCCTAALIPVGSQRP